MNGFLGERLVLEPAEHEPHPPKRKIGILNIEYNSRPTVTSPEGKILFDSDSNAIDVHIIYRTQEESDQGFISNLSDSLHDLAAYITENKETLFKDVTTIRGFTYDAMAKIANRLGFTMQEIDGKSIGSTYFKIVGEYQHTQRAARGKKIEKFYAISMPIESFLESWKLSKDTN
jgi:hypothetical protein